MSPTSLEDTIGAISTPPGEGGIGIVRLSGGQALTITAEVFVSSRGRDLLAGRGRIFHGEIRDDGASVDEVLVHVMRAPHSYTREHVVEINCHGGAGPLNAILELVLRHGARLAEPGEFTKRAFLNGRIDLIQAEAVIDRIQSKTRAGLRAAAAAAGGALSTAIAEIRDALIEAKAHIEAAIDFPEEDEPEMVTPELRVRIEETRERMQHLLDTADAGRLYREGATVAIAGATNVGKSSLFNALLRDARAIVTTQAGTTRDLLQEVITISGIPVTLLDMAGLRETGDEVEKLGVEAARQALKSAAVVLFVMDATRDPATEDAHLAHELGALQVPIFGVLNKIDIAEDAPMPAFDAPFAAQVRLSAKTGAGLDSLETELARLLMGGAQIEPGQGMLNRLHQKDSLRRALESVDALLKNYEASPEFLSLDLQDALTALGEITGETTPDDILERIFSTFCIGK